MPFISKVEHQRLLDIEKDSDAQERSHKKKTKELKEQHNKTVKELEKQTDKLTTDLEVMTAKHDALDALHESVTDAAAKKLEQDEADKQLKRREDNADKREKALDAEESHHYQSGYEDGVADGLRKGTEIGADQMQQAFSVAALAAVSHSDAATQELAKQVVKGMEQAAKTRALPAGKTKK